MLGKALTTAAAGAAGAAGAYIEDVFSTYLYEGNNATQTITNGVDLAGEGGLVWLKVRTSGSGHQLYDTVRGATNALNSKTTQSTEVFANGLTSFNSDGFDLGDNGGINGNGDTYASWTFRKAENFFDVVTYTGTGSARTVAHNLGSVPGCIIVKRTDAVDNWTVYHTSLGNTKYLELNQTVAADIDISRWNNTTPTSTVFTVGTDAAVNASGGTYVAYLFAHDAGGFGDDGTESVIKCGTFTCDGGGNVGTVSLGWEPQWILVKRTDNSTQNWLIFDTMRGWDLSDNFYLSPNLTSGENNIGSSFIAPTATGFSGTGNLFGPSAQVIYIAIRRGPMKTPTSGAEVFSAIAATGSTGTKRTTGFPIDLLIGNDRSRVVLVGTFFSDRLRGVSTTSTATGEILFSHSANAESTIALTLGFDNTGSKDPAFYSPYPMALWNFRRAPGFFDVVAYAGGSPHSRSHNLGAVPELILVKNRSFGENWAVYAGDPTSYLVLNSDAGESTSGASLYWSNTAPTSSTFTSGAAGATGGGGYNYIAYLFATVSGVSKVGSYTGTGTTLNVDCGFTTGARFVLIKRTNSTGDWYVWDTARGIVSGNDPYLLLNSTAAEVTSTDYIDPLSSGFQISSSAPAAINASGGSFIFLAIA